MEDHALLAKEQTGFRRGRSTLDNCYIPHHLITKYMRGHEQLYAASINLSAAFDSINRQWLWKEMLDGNIGMSLLILMKALVSGFELASHMLPTDSYIQGCLPRL